VHIRTTKDVASVVVDGIRIDVVVHAPVEGSHSVRGDELRVKPQVDVYVEFSRAVAVAEARQLWDDLELFWSLLTGNSSDLVAGLASEQAGPVDVEDGRDGITDLGLPRFRGHPSSLSFRHDERGVHEFDQGLQAT
jgi:hypothetical protein